MPMQDRAAADVLDFSVVDESADWIVVNKPAPLQIHPSKPDGPPTLWHGLRALLAYDLANGAALSIINRLDRETSGLVLIAKNPATARAINKAMMRREIRKEYAALVTGWPEADQWTTDAPIRPLPDPFPRPPAPHPSHLRRRPLHPRLRPAPHGPDAPDPRASPSPRPPGGRR